MIQPLIYIFVRASVHYALFEDEGYLLPQLRLLEQIVGIISAKQPDKEKETEIAENKEKV